MEMLTKPVFNVFLLNLYTLKFKKKKKNVYPLWCFADENYLKQQQQTKGTIGPH